MGRFDSLVMDDDQLHYKQRIIEDAELLEESINCIPASRETELALTHLEDCVTWATKALSRHGLSYKRRCL